MPFVIKRYPKGTSLPPAHVGYIFWTRDHVKCAERLEMLRRKGLTKEQFEDAYKLASGFTGVADFLVIEWGEESNEFGPISP